MHTYDIKLNGLILPCHVCRKITQTTQHHVHGRRYSDRCIWVCDACHKEIHANPKWAYGHGYLIEHSTLPITKKTGKRKICKHTKTYFRDGKIICQLCNKIF